MVESVLISYQIPAREYSIKRDHLIRINYDTISFGSDQHPVTQPSLTIFNFQDDNTCNTNNNNNNNNAGTLLVGYSLAHLFI